VDGCLSQIFFPDAVETAGTWDQSAIGQLFQEIGRRTITLTKDTREMGRCSMTYMVMKSNSKIDSGEFIESN